MIIAHRANVYGPNPKTENTIESIDFCVKNYINIEIDIWYKDGKYFLGHDEPKIEFDPIKYNFGIINVFFHCKTLETFFNLRKFYLNSKQFDLFIHNKDDATITNCGYMWTYPGKELFKDSIAVMPEIISEFYLEDVRKKYIKNEIKAVCTDYVLEWTDEVRNRK